MRLPIIVSESGNLNFYRTLEYAQIDIEPIDVQNAEYVIYDADGFLLVPRVVHERRVEVVQIIPTPEIRKAELKELLTNFFSEVGHERTVLETMDLAQLVEIGKAYVKDRHR